MATNELQAADELVEVTAYLHHGNIVALPVGNMAGLFRVHHDPVTGETAFEWDGLAAITGAFNTARRVSK